MKPFFLCLVLGGLLGAGVAWMSWAPGAGGFMGAPATPSQPGFARLGALADPLGKAHFGFVNGHDFADKGVTQGSPLRVQFPPQGGEGCEPQVYLFLNGEFFRMLPVPGGEPQELFPVEPVPNPFGGS